MMDLVLAFGLVVFGYVIYLAVKKSDPKEVILHDVKVVMPEVAEIEKPVKIIVKAVKKKELKKAAKRAKAKLKKKK